MNIRKWIIFLCFILSPSLFADFTYHGIDGEMGFLWKKNTGYDTAPGDSGPSLLTFIPGISAFFTFDDHWFFKPSLFLYLQNLEYLSEKKYTIPVDPSNFYAVTVGAINLETAFGYSWTLNKTHTIGLQGGPSFNLMVPFKSNDDNRKAMQESLLEEIFYFNFALWYYNPLTERFGFTFKIETALPMYNLWTDRHLGFSDGLMVYGMVGIRVLSQ